MDHCPRVSIGMAVRNGENYIEEAIDSVLAQTFGDFELIISDNASTDRTSEICQAYERKDDRIRYYRNERNIGFAENANRTFELARGEYFKWADHDDVIAPTYLEKCVEVLDRRASFVLCHSMTRLIDEKGEPIRDEKLEPKTASENVDERFYDLVTSWHPCYESCAVIRADALKRTPLYTERVSSDYALLARLGLMGKFYKVPESLFFYRRHPDQSIAAEGMQTMQGRAEWWHPNNAGKLVFPHWALFLEYLKAIYRSELSLHDRMKCYSIMVRWCYQCRGSLIADMRSAVSQIAKNHSSFARLLRL